MKKIVILFLLLIFLAACGNKNLQPAKSSIVGGEIPPAVPEVASWLVFEKESFTYEKFSDFIQAVQGLAQSEWSADARLQIISSVVEKDLSVAQYFFNFYSQSKKDQGECSNLFIYYNDVYAMNEINNSYQLHTGSGKPVNNQKLFAYTPIKDEACRQSEINVGSLEPEKIQKSSIAALNELKAASQEELTPNSPEGNYYLLMIIPTDAGQYWWLGDKKIEAMVEEKK
jgi:hypothetical protein